MPFEHYSLTLNGVSQANIQKLYQKSVELLTDTEVPGANLESKTDSFISLASSLDLEVAYSESNFIKKIIQLAQEAQILLTDKCAEKFMLASYYLEIPCKLYLRNCKKEEDSTTLFHAIIGLTV